MFLIKEYNFCSRVILEKNVPLLSNSPPASIIKVKRILHNLILKQSYFNNLVLIVIWNFYIAWRESTGT